MDRVEAINPEECQEINMSDLPREEEPIGTKCDPEKEKMLREPLREQDKELPKELQEEYYIELIIKNHDVFLKDKQDLGKAWVMEHEVKLRDEEPLYRKQVRLAEEHRSQLILAHLENWMKLGVVSPSKSH